MEAGAERYAASDRRFAVSRAFTLFDLLVSIAVIAVLMSIMLPVLSHVTEATKRVICRSNVRQIGLCVALYADDNEDRLPPSMFSEVLEQGEYLPQEMMSLRVSDGRSDSEAWDGLGVLYELDYIKTPEIFYCPSHRGMHPYEVYAEAWNTPGMNIVGNYHFRAIPADQAFLHGLDPSTAIIADGMRTIQDFNHKEGCNVVRADMSVSWFDDANGALTGLLPPMAAAAEADNLVSAAWWMLERSTLDNFEGLPWSTDLGNDGDASNMQGELLQP